jgi:hypothetical protein
MVSLPVQENLMPRISEQSLAYATTVATAILKDAEDYGSFYEEFVQELTFTWAYQAASEIRKGRTPKPPSNRIWNKIANEWVSRHNLPELSPTELKVAAELIRPTLEDEAIAFADSLAGGEQDR